MSIKVQNLVKIYGSQRAVSDISFTIEPGEIVGFLGPNGAGKSTTMKILTGYLHPSEGTVHVGGFDLISQKYAAQQTTGYLPEHNPLYLDMYVKEFLLFSGKLFGMKGTNLNERVEQMILACGLEGERKKKIEALSKGYRQRVGLAHAFLHNPTVLILDEPTTGLDPNQIVEIRDLIRREGRNKTVLLSTHIMQEVEALCDRVIIINKGKIVINSLLAEMKAAGKSLEQQFAELTSA